MDCGQCPYFFAKAGEFSVMNDQNMRCGNYVVSLLKSVLNDAKPADKPDDFDWETIYNFCNTHNVSAMAYYAIKPQIELLIKRFSSR